MEFKITIIVVVIVVVILAAVLIVVAVWRTNQHAKENQQNAIGVEGIVLETKSRYSFQSELERAQKFRERARQKAIGKPEFKIPRKKPSNGKYNYIQHQRDENVENDGVTHYNELDEDIENRNPNKEKAPNTNSLLPLLNLEKYIGQDEQQKLSNLNNTDTIDTPKSDIYSERPSLDSNRSNNNSRKFNNNNNRHNEDEMHVNNLVRCLDV